MYKVVKKTERDKIRKRHTGNGSCPVCRKFEIKGKGDKKFVEITSYTGECDAIKLLNMVESMLENE